MTTACLFEPLPLRSLTLRNRIAVSPMCQYSCEDGFVTDWHLVHLGSRAVGGAALVMAEASAVQAIGRISPADAGIWKDEHIAPWKRVVRFVKEQGAVAGIQLAHAGWKGSTAAPWKGGKQVPPEQGGWTPLGVGNQPFTEGYPVPRSLAGSEIDDLCLSWRNAARRALEAGFELIEIHAAHGYLLHSFLSPLCNDRPDQYGGSFENRTSLLLRITSEIRSAIPETVPLFVRLSCSDWIDGGWTVDDTVRVSSLLRDAGVDLIDCSSGGASPSAKIPVGPGYQTAFAERVRKESGILTGAVGMISNAHQAETICRTGQADLVFLAREMLRDPNWPRRAARELGIDPGPFTPVQYTRAW